jgi:hypothetical protein
VFLAGATLSVLATGLIHDAYGWGWVSWVILLATLAVGFLVLLSGLLPDVVEFIKHKVLNWWVRLKHVLAPVGTAVVKAVAQLRDLVGGLAPGLRDRTQDVKADTKQRTQELGQTLALGDEALSTRRQSAAARRQNRRQERKPRRNGRR